MRRFREAYIGAVFTFFGQKYRVHSHEEGAVVLNEAEPNLKTEGGVLQRRERQTASTVGLATGLLQAFYGVAQHHYELHGLSAHR